MAETENDRYAGDAAWREWLERCAVSRCGDEARPRLRAQISSAMYARLKRLGLAVADTQGEDPVAFFDSYFALKGSRDAPKPLKAYFSHRISKARLRLVDFVCGTLFGALSGRVHDIAVEWVAALKGWRPRSLRDSSGRRRFVWENAGAEGVASLEAVDAAPFDAAELCDVEPLRAAALRTLDGISSKTGLEKGKVALLLHVTAQDVPLTETAVLDGLGIAKSRAYSLKDKTMDIMRKLLANEEGGDTVLFARVFLETCRSFVTPEVLAKLEGAEK